MRANRFFLGNRKAHFARNFTFDENKIETRHSINYERLKITGKFVGAEYFDPRQGLNAISVESKQPSLVVVTTDGIWFIDKDCEVVDSIKTGKFTHDVFMYQAENYLIISSLDSGTSWVNHNWKLHSSAGTNLESCGESHDTFVELDHEHYLSNNSDMGIYIHGRNIQSISVGCQNSFLIASDILGKRQCPENSDVLLMEEQAVFSDPIGGPSSFGRTIRFAKLSRNSLNGEGEIYDFREEGVLRHNTIEDRETRYTTENGQIVKLRSGWDDKRITNVALNSVTAVGIFAVTELPLDIMFRSQYGVHFLKTVLGEGTFNDETINSISQDVDTLLDFDTEPENTKTGHWLKGNRMFITTGYENTSTTNSFVVANQSLTFSEDRTPRFGWEGAWQLDNGIEDVKRFIQLGKDKDDYVIVVEDQLDSIYVGKFGCKTGYDIRDGVKLPVDQTYISGDFQLSGLRYLDSVTDGIIDAIINQSTKSITISIRTDCNSDWTEWKKFDISESGKSMFSDIFGQPPSDSDKGTFFEFKIDAVGYLRILNVDIEYKQSQKKNSLRRGATPLTCSEEQYLR